MDKRNKIEPKGQSWEQALRDKLDSYDYPMGDLPPFSLPDVKSHRRELAPWWVVATTVAASLLLAVLSPQKSVPVIVPSTTDEVGFTAQSPVVEQLPDAPLLASNEGVGRVTLSRPNTETARTTNMEPDVVTKAEVEPVDDVVVVSSEIQVIEDNVAPTEKRKDKVYIEPIKQSVGRGLSIAVNVSGQPTSGRAGGGGGEPPMEYSILGVIERFASVEEQGYSVREKLPTEVGITAIVPIASKLSIESGLHYVLRRFEVTRSRTFMPEQYDMNVHLLGIPLGLQYEVVHLGRLGFNASAGVSGNLPVVVSVHGDQREEQKAHFALDGYLTLGADYRVSESIALAASVGGAYDIIPLNQRLFEDTSSRLRLKMNVGLKFRIQ